MLRMTSHVGTLGRQAADAVAITGGTIDVDTLICETTLAASTDATYSNLQDGISTTFTDSGSEAPEQFSTILTVNLTQFRVFQIACASLTDSLAFRAYRSGSGWRDWKALQCQDTPLKPSSYTVATLPSASAEGVGAIVYVTDDVGGAVPAFSDATAWRRTTDRAVVSTT